MIKSDEYVKRILKVLIYIEDRADEEMSLEQLAKIASYSPFHFHRIFQIVVGETVHQYVKRLRLEKAAGRLINTSKPITEIALDASFDTPSAFTKAFKQFMGHSPRKYRNLHEFEEAVRKNIAKYPHQEPEEIKTIDELDLLFIRRAGYYGKSPWQAWDAMWQFIEENSLDWSQLRYFSILHDDERITEADKVRCDACIMALPGIKERGDVSRQKLKGGKYAIFTHKGPYEELEEVCAGIFFNLLLKKKYVLDDTRPSFLEHYQMEKEHYQKEDAHFDSSQLITKIYMPVISVAIK